VKVFPVPRPRVRRHPSEKFNVARAIVKRVVASCRAAARDAELHGFVHDGGPAVDFGKELHVVRKKTSVENSARHCAKVTDNDGSGI
jgi:hypothetical protein